MNRDNKKGNKETNLLELIPMRVSDWKNNDEGLVTLILPKFKSKIGKMFSSRLKNPMYEVKLDAIGAFLWKECNGRKSVHDISIELVKEFGDEIEPVYERIKIFLNMLKNIKAIELN